MRINVGARLRAERKSRNLSQADLERRTGLARCRLSWLENGRAVPTIETLEKISDALEIPLYRLLYDGNESVQVANASSKIAANGNKAHVTIDLAATNFANAALLTADLKGRYFFNS